MKLSICYIVKNEGKKLKKSLESIAGLLRQGAELIVTDTGSADDTVRIAAAYGAKLLHYPWQDDFAAARNYVIAQATGDWILFLDADEYFTQESIPYLEGLLARAKEKALLCQRLDIDGSEDKVLGDIYVLRIFRRLDSLRYIGRIHEELREHGRPIGQLGVIPPDKVRLYHTGYEGALRQEKAARNLRILLAELQDSKEPQRLYMYLAECYNGLEDWENMERYARLDIALGRQNKTYASRSYHLLLLALMKQGRHAERRELAAQAVSDYPELPEFWAEWALCQGAAGNYRQGIQYLEEALQRAKNFPKISLEPYAFGEDMQKMAQEQLSRWKECVKMEEKNRPDTTVYISACLIAGNEEKNLPNWFEKAWIYSDEIIYVDTGSTDSSAAIAREANAKVFSYPWQNDFAAARNFALAQVSPSSNWIVFLDADEVFLEPEKVRDAVMKLQKDHAEGGLVQIVNVDEDREDREISRFSALRVWKRDDRFCYHGTIHEAVYATDSQGMRVLRQKETGLTVRHTGYSSGRIHRKLERNLALLMQEIEREGEKPIHARYLADCCFGLEDYELAEHYARKAIVEGPETVAGNESLYRIWFRSARKNGRSLSMQQKIIKKGREEYPKNRELWLLEQELSHEILQAAKQSGDKKQLSLLKEQLPAVLQKMYQLAAAGQDRKLAEYAKSEAMQSLQVLCAALLKGKGKGSEKDASGVLSGEIAEYIQVLPPVFSPIFRRYFTGSPRLQEENWEAYQLVFRFLKIFASEEDYQNYAELALDFSWEKVLTMIQELVKVSAYSAAMMLIAEIPAEFLQSPAAAAEFWYQAGVCMYHLRMEGAAECLERARQAGNQSPDIAAYLSWLDSEVKA